ncbi:unnamed protein product [Protopolystoma xenopodis]|uniref:Uncharacterized protein n=1 Tax=Protopolystoma xenopodis TaxID=117903 RepID=A0A448WRF6_9PLAT|nr:unnamed protein product [Protopolystoma xenopodis]
MTFSEFVFVPLGMGIIKTIVYAYEYLTWPLYYMFKKTLNYIPLPDSPYESDATYREEEKRILALPIRQGDVSAPWRAVEAMDKLADEPIPGCRILPDIWMRTIKLYSDQPGFGTRAILKTDYEVRLHELSYIALYTGGIVCLIRKFHWLLIQLFLYTFI